VTIYDCSRHPVTDFVHGELHKDPHRIDIMCEFDNNVCILTNSKNHFAITNNYRKVSLYEATDGSWTEQICDYKENRVGPYDKVTDVNRLNLVKLWSHRNELFSLYHSLMD